MSLLSKLGLLSVLPLGLALASTGCLAPSAADDMERIGAAVAADDGSVAGQLAAPPPAWSGGYIAPGTVLVPSGGTLQGVALPTAGQFVGSLPGGYGGSLPSAYGSAIPGAFPGAFGESFPPAGSVGAFPGQLGGTMTGVYAGGTVSSLPAQYQGLGNYWLDQGGQFPHFGWEGEASPLFYGDWSGPGFPRYPQGGTAWGSSYPTVVSAPAAGTPLQPGHF